MNNNYLKWSKVNYAGESHPPVDPVTPSAGSWSLTYLKKDKNNNFLDPNRRPLKLPIKQPNQIDFEKELQLVKRTLRSITPIQKKLAVFYGTGVPTKQWTPIIDRLIDTYEVTPVYAARILAATHMAINDTMIVVWNLKYKWNVARPNQYDQQLKTLICTPRFPTYPSGHASMSGCAEVLLSYFFPKEASKLRKIAEDDAVSRLYGGVHFTIDNNEGLKLGRYIGHVIVKHLKTQRNADRTPIDTPFTNNRNAKIDADNFQQFIPFDFKDSCSSLTESQDTSKPQKSHKKHRLPKPRLYL
ncbi:MAG: vanadium-dependent haloperoxidase [Melioribacteraceae bacterium]|nr:vanadium-dependent haloperoxidase [Melioribacteraceae bacterium]